MAADSDPIHALLAEQEIRNSLSRFAMLSDEGDLAGYRALLADDVHFDMFGNVTEGGDQVVAGAAARRETGTTGPGSNTRHLITTVQVDVRSASDASSHAAWLFFTDTKGSKTLTVMGTYNDRWVNNGDGWKIASRTVTAA